MKILVTGGAGYIGSHVVKQLCDQKQHTILIVDNLSTGFGKTIGKLMTYDNKVSFINHNLDDWQKTKRILREGQFDAVVHCAGNHLVFESIQNPLQYYLNNTANSINLIQQSVEYGVSKFIFSSTASVYGNVEENSSPINELASIDPMSPFGHSKYFIEQILRDTTLAYPHFQHIILRYFNVAGASNDGLFGQSTPSSATHLIKVAAQVALGKKEYMAIFGDDYNTKDGTCIRDYIHVDDLAYAHIFALSHLEKNNSDTFNVGYGKGFSVKEVIAMMKHVSGVDFEVKTEQRRAGDLATVIADNQKILQSFKKSSLYYNQKKLFLYDDLEVICKSALEWEKTL